jgi:V8-like Glu-specific endopeptidase
MTERIRFSNSPDEVFAFWTRERIANAPPVPSPSLDLNPELIASILSPIGSSADVDSLAAPDNGDDFPDVDGPPTPVASTTTYPWKCIGRLCIQYGDSSIASCTAGVVGINTIVTIAHAFVYPSRDNVPVTSAIFIPGYSPQGESGYASPFGEWFVDKLFKSPKATRDISTVFDLAVRDYAVAILGKRYRKYVRRSPVIADGSIANVIGQGQRASGYLGLNMDLLPQDVTDSSNELQYTCAGYPARYGGSYTMYQHQSTYAGSLIRRSGAETSDLQQFKRRPLPDGAEALQAFRNPFGNGAMGAPFLHRGASGHFQIVGMMARQEPNSDIAFSPTISSLEFRQTIDIAIEASQQRTGSSHTQGSGSSDTRDS